jgi:hypothetical protein
MMGRRSNATHMDEFIKQYHTDYAVGFAPMAQTVPI